MQTSGSTTAARKVALVTGAGKRIGRAIALGLAQAGWDVAVHYRASETEALETADGVRALGRRAALLQCDLADEAQVRALLARACEALGLVTCVVNNASLFEYDQPATFGHAAMERHWRANVAPAVILAHALHEQRAGAADTGCVVNLLDQKLWNPNPDYFSYTLSKAALEAATVLLAQALAPRLRVCGVAPGITLVSGPMNDDEFGKARTMTPLARSSTPADIARTVRFLIESPAITGTTLLVDGGQHLQRQPRDVLFIANPQREA